jgi:hypothetical protein
MHHCVEMQDAAALLQNQIKQQVNYIGTACAAPTTQL